MRRLKCRLCRQWMHTRTSEATPKKRAAAPDADVCTDCLPVKEARRKDRKRMMQGINEVRTGKETGEVERLRAALQEIADGHIGRFQHGMGEDFCADCEDRLELARRALAGD